NLHGDSTMTPSWLRRLPLGVMLCGLAAVLLATETGCSKHGKQAPKGGSDVPPSRVKLERLVELTRAGQRALVYHVETVGMLEAEGQTEIAAGVTGIVDEVLFREGDVVDPNAVLIKVDQKRYRLDVDTARSNLKRTEESLVLAKDLYDRAAKTKPSTSDEDKTKRRGAIPILDAETAVA